MKKKSMLIVMVLGFSMALFAGCSRQTENPGTPPEDVIAGNHESSNHAGDSMGENGGDSGENNQGNESGDANQDSGVMEGAVSIKIGRDGKTDYSVDMYDNAAVGTMLGYLTDSDLLFPTYTYDEETGYVGQNIRGNYTRDEEAEVTDIHKGELYLFNDGQLRLYFKDVKGANIKATPVGYVVDTDTLTETVEKAYEDNLDDTWGVDVYFWITKHVK